MADFTITISNTAFFYAGKPTQKWGSDGNMVWGTSLWGFTADFQDLQVGKVISNSLSLADPSIAKSATHGISESLSLSEAYAKSIDLHTLSDTLTIEGDTTSETLQDAAGYYYVFTKPTSNSDERVNTSYTSGSAGSTSFTSLTATSTTWS